MNLKKRLRGFFTLSRQSNGGFTLVELIVVIAILAILAGVGVPAYSGYVKKADRAADEVLLNSVNKAFASACMMHGEDNYNVNAAVSMSGEEGARKIDAVTVDGVTDFDETFKKFYEPGEFKVITDLKYNRAIGGFEDANAFGGGAYTNLFNSLKEKYGEEIANKVLNTSLGQIGTENLFDQMNGAMNLADELNLASMTGEQFMNAYLKYIGFDADAEYENDQAKQDALMAKLESLGLDYEKSVTNAIALYAAENSTNLKTSDLNKWLGNGTTPDTLQNNSSPNTLAEAAAIYGMYLSYYKNTNGGVPEGNTLEVLTEALGDSGFATWVSSDESNAQEELNAYMTYMNIINDAAKDETARNEILANGFTNPELEDLVKDLMGN